MLEYSAIEVGGTVTAGHDCLASSLRPAPTASSDSAQPDGQAKSLKDVIRQIKADRTRATSRGKGVHIAIVDTGVCGEMKEFPEWKRSPFSTDRFENPWGDVGFHGSMVACIAAGTSADGGRFDGVAPDATLISCRVPFGDFDEAYLYPIYEHLISLVESSEIGRLVINNSWALRGTKPPSIDPSNPFLAIVRKAVNLGIVVVFAAGDNNPTAEADGDSYTNTIWGANSLDEVITVGTVDESGNMDGLPPGLSPWETCHRNGSRGPGQFARDTIKPDCVAPTYGEVMWGSGYQSMVWWGTSGAAPQVSGLAALLLSRDASLTTSEVKEIIKSSCVSLGLPAECAGAGMIDCESALALLERRKARTESSIPTFDFGEPVVRFAGLPPITAYNNTNLKEIRQ